MPIFIVGFARSGTTLCQRLVAERFQMRTLPETHYFERLRKYRPEDSRLAPDRARALLDELKPYLNMDPARHEPLLSQASVPVRALFLSLVEEQIGSASDAANGRWLEKTPLHVLHMPTILGLFPRAKFIAMLRDPLAAFASRRELNQAGKGWGEEWRPIEVLCSQWRDMMDSVKAFEVDHPDRLLRVRLEDLSTQTEHEIGRIGKFLRKAPSDAAQTAPLSTAIIQPFETWKADALAPVDPSLASRTGRSGLDDYDRWRVETLLGDLISELGYLDASVVAPPMDDVHRKLVDTIDWYRHALEKWRRRW
jgi:hypothetical protein